MSEQETDKLTPKKKSAQWKSEAKSRFLDELPRSHTVTAACDYADISPDTAYKWKKEDKIFSDAWDVAIERVHDTARAKIFERAFFGVESYVVSHGKLVYIETDEIGKDGQPVYQPLMERKYSDSLAALYARANLPEYKDKQQIDIKLQMAEQDARDKEELLAGLAAAIAHEDKESTS